jgi:hypothetical protein
MVMPNDTTDTSLTAFVGESVEERAEADHVHGVAGNGIRESWAGLALYDDTYQNAINDE